jgi:hypothetical protein
MVPEGLDIATPEARQFLRLPNYKTNNLRVYLYEWPTLRTICHTAVLHSTMVMARGDRER